jgi:aquaporin related protein
VNHCFTTEKRLSRRPSFPQLPPPLYLPPLYFEKMAADGASELPQHYGSRTTDGELIKRPMSPIIPSSPLRAYHPGSRRDYSPERTPIEPAYDTEHSRSGPSGLRRRPSTGPARRHSLGEYDRDRPSFSSGEHSKRPLRSRDDGYYRDDDRSYSRRDEHAHPDAYERSRPPRTYRNGDGYERGPSSASKPFFDESRSEYRQRDLERGEWGDDYKRESDESVDGYDYEAQKRNRPRTTIDFDSLTPEEKKQVMRLPWTQWMNSNVKNRKSLSLLIKHLLIVPQ